MIYFFIIFLLLIFINSFYFLTPFTAKVHALIRYASLGECYGETNTVSVQLVNHNHTGGGTPPPPKKKKKKIKLKKWNISSENVWFKERVNCCWRYPCCSQPFPCQRICAVPAVLSTTTTTTTTKSLRGRFSKPDYLFFKFRFASPLFTKKTNLSIHDISQQDGKHLVKAVTWARRGLTQTALTLNCNVKMENTWSRQLHGHREG